MKNEKINSMTLSDFVDYFIETADCTYESNLVFEGNATTREVIKTMVDEMEDSTYKRRINDQILGISRVIVPFENLSHKKKFCRLIEPDNYYDNFYMAAVYLLTSSEGLWAKVKDVVDFETVHFDGVKKAPRNNDYILFKIADDILTGSAHCTMRDITNPQCFDRKLFSLITKAIAICRYGVGALGFKVHQTDKGYFYFED